MSLVSIWDSTILEKICDQTRCSQAQVDSPTCDFVGVVSTHLVEYVVEIRYLEVNWARGQIGKAACGVKFNYFKENNRKMRCSYSQVTLLKVRKKLLLGIRCGKGQVCKSKFGNGVGGLTYL